VGDGFAIPHAQIEGLKCPLTLFMRTAMRVDFKAPDDKPVADFLAIMVPHDGARHDHLQMLAIVARLFSDRQFRGQLDGAPDATSAAELFRRGISNAVSALDAPADLTEGRGMSS
jgi:PTS system nitrogen regulatory IIA component